MKLQKTDFKKFDFYMSSVNYIRKYLKEEESIANIMEEVLKVLNKW